MAEHADDTFLDDELEESDFNFDNENEDALLAETDYDLIENSLTIQSVEENRDGVIDDDVSAEPDEDVLDIGIADEDIVDAETAFLDEGAEDDRQTDHIENDEAASRIESFSEARRVAARQSSELQLDKCFSRDVSSPNTRVEGGTNTSIGAEAIAHDIVDQQVQQQQPQDAVAAEKSSTCSNIEESVVTQRVEQHVEDEMLGEQQQQQQRDEKDDKEEEQEGAGRREDVPKSRIISLKKSSSRKCYDHLPDLAKVIELVQQQPSSSSNSVANSNRNRKNISPRQYVEGGSGGEGRISRKRLAMVGAAAATQQLKRCAHDYDSGRYVRRCRDRDRDNEDSYDEDDDNDDEQQKHDHHLRQQNKDDEQDDYRCLASQPRYRSAVVENDSQNSFQTETAAYRGGGILRNDLHSSHQTAASVANQPPLVASVQITQERYQITGDVRLFGAAPCTQPAFSPQPPLSLQPSPLTFGQQQQQSPPAAPFSYRPHNLTGGSPCFSNVIPLSSSSNVPFTFDPHSNAGPQFTQPIRPPLQQQLLPPPPRLRLPLPPPQQQQPLMQQSPPPRPLLQAPSISASSQIRHKIFNDGYQQQQQPQPQLSLSQRMPPPRIMRPINLPPLQQRQQFNVFRSPQQRMLQQQQQQHCAVPPSSMMQQPPPVYGANPIVRSNMMRPVRPPPQSPPPPPSPQPVRMAIDNRIPIPPPSAARPTGLMIQSAAQPRHHFRMTAAATVTAATNTFVGPPRGPPPAPMPFISQQQQVASPFIARPLPPTVPYFGGPPQQQPSPCFYNVNAGVSAAPQPPPSQPSSYDSSRYQVSQPPPPGVAPPLLLPPSSTSQPFVVTSSTRKSPHEVRYPVYSNDNYYGTNRAIASTAGNGGGVGAIAALSSSYSSTNTFAVASGGANALKRTTSGSTSSGGGCSPSKQARYENVNTKKANVVRNLHQVRIVDTLPSFSGGSPVNVEASPPSNTAIFSSSSSSWTSSRTATSKSTEMRPSSVVEQPRVVVTNAVTAPTAADAAWSWHADDVSSLVVPRRDEDEDMKVYRRKVEYQKQLREKFVQLKEEQRLKNQMQSFIQNNIKGILQKREQFLRKSRNEAECAAAVATVAAAVEPPLLQSPSPSSSPPPQRSSNKRPLRPPPQKTKRQGATSVNDSRSKYKINSQCDREATVAAVTSERITAATASVSASATAAATTAITTTTKTKCANEDDHRLRQRLHKVLKIKYKDGTVALKSIPVDDRGRSSVWRSARFSQMTNNVEDDYDDPRSSPCNSGFANNAHLHDHQHHRRMVLSKRIPAPNVDNELADESVIVESIRKGVTQSSVTLAQRFSNLKSANNEAAAAMAKVDEEEEEEEQQEQQQRQDETRRSAAMAAATANKLNRKRLVIPDENESRTVWVKNIASAISPALVQKMASTCGTVSGKACVCQARKPFRQRR